MGFIDMNFDDVKEYKSVSEGEYQLRILSAELKAGNKGQFILVKLQIMGEDPFTKDVTHVMMAPSAGDDAKQANNRKLAIKRFMEAFAIEFTGRVEPETWVGQSGWALLVEETSEEYGTQNRIRRVIAGK